MADSFFGFDTSSSNLNDDEGGGEPSEDEYDALNDETFGQDSEEFDWEVQHEHLASQLESRRRHAGGIDDAANEQLEASLSQLVLDETDAPAVRTLGSNVWRHDGLSLPTAPTPVQTLKNVCTVEELERQLRQKQQPIGNQGLFQPRFQPVILQRPPGLQAPVPLPFAPQQMRDMGQPLNKIIGQPQQLMQNHMGQNQMNQLGQGMNQMNQLNQMGQSVNQFMQSTNQLQFQNSNLMNLSQNMQSMQANQMMQGQMGQNHVPMGQTMNQMGQSGPLGQTIHNQNLVQNLQMGQNNMGPNLVQNLNQLGQMPPNHNQSMAQTLNQMNQSMNQSMNQGMNQGMNQMGQGVNQMMSNGGQFGPNMNQFPHMMGQPRMMAPPPGMNMPRQNFSPNMASFSNFRAPTMPSKPSEQQPMNQNMLNMNQQLIQQQQMKTQSPQIPIPNVKPNMNQPPLNQPPLNQSPQNKSVQKLNSTPKVEQKVQKTRVYNNTQQKTLPSQNLTSQSLVQLIQNTHPMLQLNSYHNASHHPMLNNRSNLFSNNQFVNNHFFNNNQRHNGTYSNSRHMNGDDNGSISSDEHAGLMTPREQQWLINIQMLQLNTGTPYIHDFYYTVFLERQASKEKEGIKEAHKANQQNHPFYSGAVKQESHGRERHNSARHNSTSEDAPAPRTYVPTQFENSLGKLQCGSVTAPRKLIDVEVVAADAPGPASRAPSRASTTNPSEVPRELKRTKQLLLDIEALYVVLLRLEELNDPLAISTALILKEREEKQKQLEAAQREIENEQEDESNLFLKNIESVQRRPKQDSPKSESVDKRQVVNLAGHQKPPLKNLLDEDKEELVTKMFAGLLHSDRVAQMLQVRKGRALICRFLNRVPASHVRLRGLWSRVLRALPSIARRQENSLRELAPHYRNYIHTTSGWAPILETCGFLSEALDPARTPYVLTSSFTLSCVCALIERASTLLTTPTPTGSERQWSKFLKTLARALQLSSVRVARPTQPLPAAVLAAHVQRLDSRSGVEILQRGTSVDITRADVHRMLRDHLC